MSFPDDFTDHVVGLGWWLGRQIELGKWVRSCAAP